MVDDGDAQVKIFLAAACNAGNHTGGNADLDEQ